MLARIYQATGLHNVLTALSFIVLIETIVSINSIHQLVLIVETGVLRQNSTEFLNYYLYLF
jgi:hypothetical protein